LRVTEVSEKNSVKGGAVTAVKLIVFDPGPPVIEMLVTALQAAGPPLGLPPFTFTWKKSQVIVMLSLPSLDAVSAPPE
jgi:hypothetical protein